MTSVRAAAGVLNDRIDDVHRSVSAAEVEMESVPGRLRARMGTWFPDAATSLHRELDELLDDVAHTAPIQVWARLHELSTRADRIVETCLALVAGAAQRRDDDICTIADALVDEIVGRTGAGTWRSFTVPAPGEVYSLASSSIGVRFPGSFWDLAVVAHEAGHLVGEKVAYRDGTTLRRWMVSEDREGSWASRAHADELAADLVAAYVLGPAYAWSCVHRRFDPLLADVPQLTHPPTTRRVRAILAGLAVLGGPRNRQTRAALWQTWSDLVTASSGAPPPGPDRDGYLASVAAEVGRRLPAARYSGWAEAERLGRALAERGALPPRVGSATLVEVVNAAWFARRIAPRRSDSIRDRAWSVCLRVMGES